MQQTLLAETAEEKKAAANANVLNEAVIECQGGLLAGMNWLVSREDHESNAHAVSLPHHVGVEPLPIAAFEKIDAFLTGSADLNEGSVAKAGTDGIDVCKRGLQKLSSLVEEKSATASASGRTATTRCCSPGKGLGRQERPGRQQLPSPLRSRSGLRLNTKFNCKWESNL